MTQESDDQLSQRPHFNLVDEPWIIVRTSAQQTEELSLLEVFKRAPEVESLANENAQQDFAILRVLLAILQRAISPTLDEDDDPAEVWGSLWESGTLPLTDIRSYLSEWHDRFDLFDRERPFMQVIGLDANKGDTGKLMFASDHKPELAPSRTGLHKSSLSFPEAARWLVTVQAFDIAGNKSGVAGDPALSGGNVNAKRVGWAGQLGGICAEGRSLWETLMLNLVLWGDEPDELFDPDDLPAWEQECVSPYRNERSPLGRADLYTWQPRRILLFADGGRVREVILAAGDIADAVNLQTMEPMTAWEDKADRSHSRPHYVPKRFELHKAFWRGLESILPTLSQKRNNCVAPGVVRWIGYLSSANGGRRVPVSYRLRLRAVGLVYGNQSSSIQDAIDDSIGIHSYLLSLDGSLRAVPAVLACVRATEDAVECLGKLASRLAYASGYESSSGKKGVSVPEMESQSAEAEAYFEIDREFREWLMGIDGESDLVASQMRWARFVSKAVNRLSDELLRQADGRAIVGRRRKVKKKDVLFSAGKAKRYFDASLRNALRPISLDEHGEKGVTS